MLICEGALKYIPGMFRSGSGKGGLFVRKDAGKVKRGIVSKILRLAWLAPYRGQDVKRKASNSCPNRRRQW